MVQEVFRRLANSHFSAKIFRGNSSCLRSTFSARATHLLRLFSRPWKPYYSPAICFKFHRYLFLLCCCCCCVCVWCDVCFYFLSFSNARIDLAKLKFAEKLKYRLNLVQVAFFVCFFLIDWVYEFWKLYRFDFKKKKCKFDAVSKYDWLFSWHFKFKEKQFIFSHLFFIFIELLKYIYWKSHIRCNLNG